MVDAQALPRPLFGFRPQPRPADRTTTPAVPWQPQLQSLHNTRDAIIGQMHQQLSGELGHLPQATVNLYLKANQRLFERTAYLIAVQGTQDPRMGALQAIAALKKTHAGTAAFFRQTSKPYQDQVVAANLHTPKPSATPIGPSISQVKTHLEKVFAAKGVPADQAAKYASHASGVIQASVLTGDLSDTNEPLQKAFNQPNSPFPKEVRKILKDKSLAAELQAAQAQSVRDIEQTLAPTDDSPPLTHDQIQTVITPRPNFNPQSNNEVATHINTIGFEKAAKRSAPLNDNADLFNQQQVSQFNSQVSQLTAAFNNYRQFRTLIYQTSNQSESPFLAGLRYDPANPGTQSVSHQGFSLRSFFRNPFDFFRFNTSPSVDLPSPSDLFSNTVEGIKGLFGGAGGSSGSVAGIESATQSGGLLTNIGKGLGGLGNAFKGGTSGLGGLGKAGLGAAGRGLAGLGARLGLTGLGTAGAGAATISAPAWVPVVAVIAAIVIIVLIAVFIQNPRLLTQVQTTGPPVAEAPNFGTVTCSLDKGPMSSSQPSSSPIAARAWAIVADLYQGFWCYWNRSPGDVGTDVCTYPACYPEIFDYPFYLQNPNPTRDEMSTNAFNMFWCTQLVVKAYQEAGGNLPSITYLSSAMKESFVSANRFLAANPNPNQPDEPWATPQNPPPAGSVIFFRFADGPARTNHVAIVTSVAGNAIYYVQSNAGAKEGSLTLLDAGVQDMEGVDIEGFGLP